MPTAKRQGVAVSLSAGAAPAVTFGAAASTPEKGRCGGEARGGAIVGDRAVAVRTGEATCGQVDRACEDARGEEACTSAGAASRASAGAGGEDGGTGVKSTRPSAADSTATVSGGEVGACCGPEGGGGGRGGGNTGGDVVKGEEGVMAEGGGVLPVREAARDSAYHRRERHPPDKVPHETHKLNHSEVPVTSRSVPIRVSASLGPAFHAAHPQRSYWPVIWRAIPGTDAAEMGPLAAGFASLRAPARLGDYIAASASAATASAAASAATAPASSAFSAMPPPSLAPSFRHMVRSGPSPALEAAATAWLPSPAGSVDCRHGEQVEAGAAVAGSSRGSQPRRHARGR